MKWSFQRTTWENSIRANFMLSAVCIVMSVITLFSTYTALSMHERIVIVPAGVSGKVELGWSSADAGYYKAFGLFVTTLIGNITPSNVHFVADSLSSYMDSAIYSNVRKKMLSLADSIQFKESAEATKFVPMNVFFEPDTHKVFVQGKMMLTSSVSNKTDEVVYEMKLSIKNGQPMVESIESYPGMEPHTQLWINNQQKMAGDKPADAGASK